MKPKIPPSSEWDFTAIEENELPFCIAWEYARNAPTTYTAVKQWQTKKTTDGKTVMDWVKNVSKLEPFKLPDSMILAEIHSMWPVVKPLRLTLVEFGHLFPKPWISTPRTKGALRPSSSLKAIPSKALPIMLQHFPEKILKDDGYFIRVDFKHSKLETIISELERWARREARKFDRPRIKGKASEPPYAKLKRLAAWRFNKDNVRWKDAHETISNHRKKLQSQGIAILDVLPFYAKQSGWIDAVSECDNDLKKYDEDLLARIKEKDYSQNPFFHTII